MTCLCSHDITLHALGQVAGQRVRKACSAWECGCTRYCSPGVVEQRRCPTCGVPWAEQEAVRTDD